jgi:hypothetical protein
LGRHCFHFWKLFWSLVLVCGRSCCIFVPLSRFICCNWFARKSRKFWFMSTTLLLVKWFVDCNVKGCLRERRPGTIKQWDLNLE